jgi:hypothetical protein
MSGDKVVMGCGYFYLAFRSAHAAVPLLGSRSPVFLKADFSVRDLTAFRSARQSNPANQSDQRRQRNRDPQPNEIAQRNPDPEVARLFHDDDV